MMSLFFCYDGFSLIDHHDFISKIYNQVFISPNEYKSFVISRNIFSISNDSSVKVNNSRKRKKDLDEEASSVRVMFESFLLKVPSIMKDQLCHNYKLSNSSSSSVRNIAKGIFESTIFLHNGISGGNNSNFPLKCIINDDCFLIPQNSRFYCGDVTEQCKRLNGCKFDIVVADPPWWNKYIRRLKAANSKLSYSMMHNEEIASIPVKNLLAENCLVAVWCTNSPSNVTAVKDLIFPKWGVKYVTTWYWVKMTVDFQPVCEFGSECKKQPYERIIFGKLGEVKDIPKEHLVISVPSALHSHKPPLLDVLRRYLEVEDPQTLELFARYLLPNTTSVGFEPLKWQHISLYETSDET